MRKNLLKTMVALAAFCLGSTTASAGNETTTAPVKMTYVSGSDADVDVAYGECDTIKAGWNRGDLVAVGSTIGFGNKAWGANWIGVIKADLSAIPGTVQKATLKAKVSGSLDSKRNTGWGVALTDNKWSADLTYTTVSTWTVSAMLNGGEQVWTASKSATGFEEQVWDITDAFAGGQSVATILVYQGVKANNGGAAGGFMTEAEVEVEYEPFEATTTKFDFEDGNKVFTDDSRITSAIEADATLSSNVLGWTCANNAQNGYSFSHYDFTSLLNNPALVQIEFDYYNTKEGRAILNIGDALVRGTTGGSSKVTYNKTGVIFQIGSDKTNAFINGQILPQEDKVTTTNIPETDEEGNPVIDEETGEPKTIEVVETTPGICNKWMHVILLVNNDARTVTWIVNDMEGDNLYYGTDPFFADDANACSQIDLFGYINNSHCAMIDNLEITNYKSNAVFADYTIKYVDANGNEIKEARTGNGQVGKFVKLLDSDKAAIRTDDMKYIYDSDDSETVAIADGGTAVITVTFREAEKYYVVLNCKAGSEILKQFKGDDLWFWEGDEYALYPARYYQAKDGSYWTTPATSWNGATYKFPGSLSPNTQGGKTYYIGQLSYEKDETVAYYSDFERLALPVEDAGDGTGLGQLAGSVNNWWSFSNGIFDRFSQGRGIRLDKGSYVWTEPIAADGTYMVRIYGRNDKSANCEAPYALGLRDASGNVTLLDVAIPDWGSATTGESIIGAAAAEATEETAAVEAAGIGIKAGEQLVVINTGNGDMISLDDIKLTKVADYAATATKAPAYSVAGAYVVKGDETETQNAAFFGAAWDPSKNDMTANEDGTYSKKFEGVTFEQTGTIYYKVALNHGWVESYGFDGNNADYYVEVPEGSTVKADVVFTFNPETKTVSCDLQNKETIEIPATWTLAGAFEANGEQTALFFGETWNPALEQNDMTANEDGTYTISFKNVEFETAGTIWYKVCKNHAWDESYGMDKKDGNAEYIVNEPCTVGEIVFTFNPAAEGFKVSCEFKDIVTGINSIAANGQTVVVYNLKGQRVMNAQKGLYIQNGKKVVIK